MDFLFHFDEIPLKFTLAFLNPRTTTGRTMSNPPSLRGQTTNFNRRDVLAVEMPSANGIGQVRSLAELYSEFVTGGTRLGLKRETLDELFAPGASPTSNLKDLVLLDRTAYSLGFRKPAPAFKFGTNSRSFGVGGIGGSLAFGDPDAQVAFAYAMTRPGFLIFDDPRAKALRDALSRCLSEF